MEEWLKNFLNKQNQQDRAYKPKEKRPGTYSPPDELQNADDVNLRRRLNEGDNDGGNQLQNNQWLCPNCSAINSYSWNFTCSSCGFILPDINKREE